MIGRNKTEYFRRKNEEIEEGNLLFRSFHR